MNATAPAFNPTNAQAMNTNVKSWTPGAQPTPSFTPQPQSTFSNNAPAFTPNQGSFKPFTPSSGFNAQQQ